MSLVESVNSDHLEVQQLNLLCPDPEDLLKTNPAALIVNRESYNLIAAAFSPLRFDPPQVALVQDRNGTTTLQLIDGHTRTYAVATHLEEIKARYPEFVFRVRDVTLSLISNPRVVLPAERSPNLHVLTTVQALRAIVPPTVEHSQIAPDRIAAHLINAWNNMVGPNIAERFSAIAALNLLRNPSISIANENLFRQSLLRQGQILAGETETERRIIGSALLEMASIIKQTRLIKERVAESAFVLVASGSTVIGGERESLKQIYSLLHTPVVEQRLSEEAGVREQMRQELGINIAEAFTRFSADHNKDQIINSLGQAIRDPRLTYKQVATILSSSKPIEAYDEIKRDINEERLKKTYIQDQRREATAIERQLIAILGRRIFLEDRDLPTLLRTIRSAAVIMDQVRQFQDSLSTQRESFLNRGVRGQTLQESSSVLEQAQIELLSAQTAQNLSVKVHALEKIAQEFRRRINRECAIYSWAQIVDEIFGKELQAGHGSMIKGRILAYLIAEFPMISSETEQAVRQRVRQLTTLNEALQARVISGDVRIQTALRMQQEERVSFAGSTTPVAPKLTRSNDHISEVDDVFILEPPENRIESNNRRLHEGGIIFEELLKTVDLDPKELTPETGKVLENILRQLGRISTGHPDIVRMIEKYPQLLQDLSKMRAAIFYQEEESINKDARTGR